MMGSGPQQPAHANGARRHPSNSNSSPLDTMHTIISRIGELDNLRLMSLGEARFTPLELANPNLAEGAMGSTSTMVNDSIPGIYRAGLRGDIIGSVSLNPALGEGLMAAKATVAGLKLEGRYEKLIDMVSYAQLLNEHADSQKDWLPSVRSQMREILEKKAKNRAMSEGSSDTRIQSRLRDVVIPNQEEVIIDLADPFTPTGVLKSLEKMPCYYGSVPPLPSFDFARFHVAENIMPEFFPNVAFEPIASSTPLPMESVNVPADVGHQLSTVDHGLQPESGVSNATVGTGQQHEIPTGMLVDGVDEMEWSGPTFVTTPVDGVQAVNIGHGRISTNTYTNQIPHVQHLGNFKQSQPPQPSLVMPPSSRSSSFTQSIPSSLASSVEPRTLSQHQPQQQFKAPDSSSPFNNVQNTGSTLRPLMSGNGAIEVMGRPSNMSLEPVAKLSVVTRDACCMTEDNGNMGIGGSANQKVMVSIGIMTDPVTIVSPSKGNSGDWRRRGSDGEDLGNEQGRQGMGINAGASGFKPAIVRGAKPQDESDRVHDAIGARKRSLSNQSKDCDDENDDGDTSTKPNPFMSAHDKLAYDNAKKFQRAGISGGPQPARTNSFGASNNNLGARSNATVNGNVNGTAPDPKRRTLGMSRGTGKFVSPLLSNKDRDKEADDGGGGQRKKGPNQNSGKDEDAEPIDERLKNIEPKMVEAIMNEIMDKGHSIT
ncbi:hypothetical protein HDU76_000150, partial [Blyttiomyces sp. JEL0837]